MSEFSAPVDQILAGWQELLTWAAWFWPEYARIWKYEEACQLTGIADGELLFTGYTYTPYDDYPLQEHEYRIAVAYLHEDAPLERALAEKAVWDHAQQIERDQQRQREQQAAESALFVQARKLRYTLTKEAP